MTTPHIADPAHLLDEALAGASPDLMRESLQTMMVDIRDRATETLTEGETLFDEFFTPGHPELLGGARIGLVAPQQSLRASLKHVFRSVPGLSPGMVLTPYEVAEAPEPFDLLMIDATHRLTQWGAQAVGVLTKKYREVSQRLAISGENWEELTQVNWILRQSRHQIFLLDEGQAVRPHDVPQHVLQRLREVATRDNRRLPAPIADARPGWWRLHRVRTRTDERQPTRSADHLPRLRPSLLRRPGVDVRSDQVPLRRARPGPAHRRVRLLTAGR